LQVDEIMQVSAEIRKKLAILIGNLICRCIREARLVPYVLNRDEVINLLFDDPAQFEKLVHEEHAGKSEQSREDLTLNMDAAKELGKLDQIKIFEKSFWSGPEVDLDPILDVTNQLTRTFAVYLGNASTLFDKSFEEFMDKFRSSLQRAGLSLTSFDFEEDDTSLLESSAIAYLEAGEFLQAFTYDRLLSSQIMIKQVVNLPSKGFALRKDLFRQAIVNSGLFSALIKFVLRVSYISHGAWEDLFTVLVKQVYAEPELYSPTKLIDAIEQDVIFSCNLLCNSYQEIRLWPEAQRRKAIEACLITYREKEGLS
jgi:hypothetical protein